MVAKPRGKTGALPRPHEVVAIGSSELRPHFDVAIDRWHALASKAASHESVTSVLASPMMSTWGRHYRRCVPSFDVEVVC